MCDQRAIRGAQLEKATHESFDMSHRDRLGRGYANPEQEASGKGQEETRSKGHSENNLRANGGPTDQVWMSRKPSHLT